MSKSEHLAAYLIALGSNQRHAIIGPPPAVIRHAIRELANQGLEIVAAATPIRSRPVGPSTRQYANSAAIIRTSLGPPDLIRLLQSIESKFGQRRGQRWSRRVLDLDIILWSRGSFVGHNPALTIPHPEFRQRAFVLQPATEIAAGWRDPLTGYSIAHLTARQAKAGNPALNPRNPLDP